uniref:Uncharacterized protein n=1 Tax=Panagrolaimus davidi TaxID=227884 RepID=A0A914RC34_9BILA
MPNSSEKNKSKSKNSAAVVSLLSENILKSSSDDENEEEESHSSEVSVSKSKNSIFGKGWNAFKQLFNGVPNVMVIVFYLSNYLFALINPSLKNPEKAVEGNDDSIDTESYEGITATETMEESEGTQSEPEQIEDLVVPQKDEDTEEYAVNACGWNRDEIIDCSKGNPLIMEDDMATGMPFESMPPGLRIRVIGTTIDYILFEEKKGVGFITQEVIEELFQKFTGVSLNDACQTIDMTFKDFVDLHFSAAFKNCHPHGLARLEVVDKPLQSAFDNFCSQAPPVASSSQSYITPVESDAELYSVETAHHDVVEELFKEFAGVSFFEMLSTPVASAVLSRASLFITETDENIPDLEGDLLDYVNESSKEQKKKEAEPKNKEEVQPQKEVKPKAEEVKGGAKLKDGQHVNVLSPSFLFDKSDDDETTPIKAESKPDKFLQPTLLESESDDEEKQPTGKQPMSVKKENKIPAKAVSSNAEEVADKKLNVKKDVKQKEVSSAEKKQLDYDLLDVSSEDESDVEPPKMDKKAAKKSQPPSTVDESLKKPITSSQNSTLLSKSLLFSTDSSSDDEMGKEEPPKVAVKEEKKSTTAPVKKNVEVKSSKNIANTSRLLENEIFFDSEEEEKNDLGTKKKKPTQAKSDEKKSTKSG